MADDGHRSSAPPLLSNTRSPVIRDRPSLSLAIAHGVAIVLHVDHASQPHRPAGELSAVRSLVSKRPPGFNMAPAFSNARDLLERRNRYTRMFAPCREVESIRLNQIASFENDIEVYRLTGEHHVRTDAHRLGSVLKVCGGRIGVNLGSHLVAQRTPISDEIGRPGSARRRAATGSHNLCSAYGAFERRVRGVLHMLDHSRADIENRHG